MPSWYKVYIMLGLLVFCGAASAESWMQTSEDGDPVECPDVIELSNGQYYVFNDCYGADPHRPLIETGKYSCGAGRITFTTEADLEESTSDYGNPIGFSLKKNANLVMLEANGETLYFLASREGNGC